MLAGIGAFGWQAFPEAGRGERAWIGDLFFVANAVMWSVFGLLARRWGTDAIDVTIATCLLSLLFLPVFALTMPIRLGEVAWPAIALQALYQGALVGVGALFLYTEVGRAARRGARDPVPAAQPRSSRRSPASLLLGEYPSGVEIAGMVLVIAGMSVALRAR